MRSANNSPGSAPVSSAGSTRLSEQEIISVAGITTTQANCLVIAWVLARAVSDADASGFGTVSGWTKHVGFQSEFTTPAVSLGVYSKTVASAGASGQLDAVLNNGGNNSNYPWHGGMIAIAPAGGGGPSGPTGRSPLARNRTTARGLWELSEQLTGVPFGL